MRGDAGLDGSWAVREPPLRGVRADLVHVVGRCASHEACRDQEAFAPLRVDCVDDVGDGLGCEAES